MTILLFPFRLAVLIFLILIFGSWYLWGLDAMVCVVAVVALLMGAFR